MSTYGAVETQSTHLSCSQKSMTNKQVDVIIETFAREDEDSTKTFSRLLVEKFLSHYRWYFPRKDSPHAPSLHKAWAYYEHITLPRRLLDRQSADHILKRAEPGETELTELYSPIRTPASSLIEWGAGVDLYFSTLRAISIVLLIAGLINLPNILFYTSKAYNPAGRGPVSDLPQVTFTLDTSAVCTTADWVVCTDCFTNRSKFKEDPDRIGVSQNGTVLIARNGCAGGQFTQGIVSYATGFYLALVLWIISMYMRAREIRFDEDKVTASDYTVVVTNPPPDATNPDEWRDFFSQFATKQVTCVTIGLNNGALIRKLIERRFVARDLLLLIPKDTDLNDEDAVRAAVALYLKEQAEEPRGFLAKVFGPLLNWTIIPILNVFQLFLPANALADKIFVLTDQVRKLQKNKYNAAAVYVTFETEEGQRVAHSALSVSRLDVMWNKKANLPPSVIFRDKVLRLREPTEPNTVRWMDLGSTKTYRLATRSFNFLLTIGMIAVASVTVNKTRESFGPSFSGPLVTIFNSIIPVFVKLLMLLERHKTEGTFQTSLYLKITLFRWVNTAILTKFITPFTSTVSPNPTDVLAQINAILWAEMLLSPAIKLLDLEENFKKHILAPRAPNQEAMNSNFQGTFYNLGERYTDLTKILFVCFFYSALFPGAYFFGFAILSIQYYTDRICLFRMWASTPALGSELAQFSRRYFFSGAIVAYVLVSAYTFAQFPYDNVCDPNNATTGNSGTYINVNVNNVLRNITVTQDTNVVYCAQDWTKNKGGKFPPTPQLQPPGLTWMNASQERLTILYGWTAVIFLSLFILIFFGAAIFRYVLSWVRGVIPSKGQDQQIDFSSDKEMVGYVPQVKQFGFAFPFIICDVDFVDKELVGWEDLVNSFDYHNLIFDVPYEGIPRKRLGNSSSKRVRVRRDEQNQVEPIFSVIKYYPPPWKQNLNRNNE